MSQAIIAAIIGFLGLLTVTLWSNCAQKKMAKHNERVLEKLGKENNNTLKELNEKTNSLLEKQKEQDLKAQQFMRLEDDLKTIIRLQMEYPILQNKEQISKIIEGRVSYVQSVGWHSIEEFDFAYIRYNAYCTLTFELLEKAYYFFDGPKETDKLFEFINFYPLIDFHYAWWKGKNPHSNNRFQNKSEFLNFVDKIKTNCKSDNYLK